MSEINAERWQQVEALFSAALDCPLTVREDFLKQQCHDDQELLEMVSSLLAVNEEAANFINTPAISMVFGESTPLNRPTHPKILAPFQFLFCLGVGSNGEAYKAIDQSNNSTVVLKTLSQATHNTRDHFYAQFEALSRCQHPNLSNPQELFDIEQELGFKRSFVTGVNIKSYALSHSLTELMPVFEQAVLALSHLHQTGLLHENLKLNNLFVESNGKLIITDYGLMPDCSKGIYHGNQHDESVKYFAPEQCQGRPATPATDWYSLGVILFETLTGNAPFLGSFMEVALAKKRFRAPSPKMIVPTIPTSLDKLCQALLHWDVKARPQGSEILKYLYSN